MVFTQEDRLLSIETPLGHDVLMLGAFSGHETISAPFIFDLDLYSENSNIAFADIIGQNVTISLALNDSDVRYFNGLISLFRQEKNGSSEFGQERNDDSEFRQERSQSREYGDIRLAQYYAKMVPWFWLLTRTSDSRIFQEMSVPDIIEQIFTEKGLLDYRIALKASYEPKTYCVQYRETDFNFISRLLEQEGIFYFFEHEQGKHTMVLADSSDAHAPCPNQDIAYFQSNPETRDANNLVVGFEKTQIIGVGKYTVNDFNFTIPNNDLKVEVVSQVELGPGEREVYDFPAEYQLRNEGERLANLRMQSEEIKTTMINGSSTCKAFGAGYRFELRDYYREDMTNQEYVLTSVNHNATDPIGGSDSGGGAIYMNSIDCIPYDVPYRPDLTTPKPMINLQTAIVVGPSGEEIYTDEYGRVKVQFHWDREGRKDENSSCWIRVGQTTAGSSWGSVYIPRIGHEVIVEFIEGDPDRPIITGSVYNGMNSVPFDLPNNKMVSGMKSNSTPGSGGFNEISLNDTKGNEKIVVHGQYDMTTTIEHDQTLTVHNNRTGTIDVDDSESVGNNQTISVGTDQTVDIGANQQVSIGSNQDISVGSNRTLQVGADHTESIGASHTLDVGGTQGISISGSRQLDISGADSINVGASQAINVGGPMSIEGPTITLKAAAAVVIEAPSITLNASGSSISITAGSISITSGGLVSVQGSLIKNN